jgi:hypothetical protein
MSNVVQNQDRNYSLYYNVLDYFKAIMKNHPSINYVSQGDVFSVDNREFPAYPLGNIFIKVRIDRENNCTFLSINYCG